MVSWGFVTGFLFPALLELGDGGIWQYPAKTLQTAFELLGWAGIQRVLRLWSHPSPDPSMVCWTIQVDSETAEP